MLIIQRLFRKSIMLKMALRPFIRVANFPPVKNLA